MTNLWLALAGACCVLYLFGACATDAAGKRERPPARRGWIFAILAGGLLLRVALALTTQGHPIDVGTFGAWAGHAAEGLMSFYSPGYFADYPPGYVYVLWTLGKLRLLLNLSYDSAAFSLLLKTPAILADIATAWLFYRLARRSHGGLAPTALAALYAFNPAVILDSAVWGQVDSVLTLFVLLGVCLLERNPAGSAAAFAVALLVKPQALIFAPLPILWFVRLLAGRRAKGALAELGQWHGRLAHASQGHLAPGTCGQSTVKMPATPSRAVALNRGALADLLIFSAAGSLVFLLGVSPFVSQHGLGWVYEKYHGTMASYDYATLNAFNFFALTGANGAATSDKLLGLPYSAWGTAFIVLIVAFSSLAALRGKDTTPRPWRFWYIALFLSAGVFVLSAKMHERYLFPALALALGCFIAGGGRWGLWLFACFSVTQFLNMAEVLALSYQNTFLVPRLSPLLLGVSGVNVALLAWLVVMGARSHGARRDGETQDMEIVEQGKVFGQGRLC